MCTVFLSPVSLRCLPSTVLSAVNTRADGRHCVQGGGEGEGNACCIIYRFSSMSMLCAHFSVTFQRLRKKATKQCNGEKDLQHSTIELKQAWRIKQMPWLTLTVPSLAIYLCSLVCRSHVEEMGTQQRTMARAAILHELLIITRAIYYVGSSLIPFSQASLSSVKSNEQMLLSCWSQ